MKEQKYFIPEIGDIRVGYECEKEDSIKGYEPYTFDLKGVRDVMQDEISDYREAWFRTSYLSKEQIRAEGWIPNENFDYYFTRPYKNDCDKTLFLQVNYNYFNVPVWITIGYEHDLTDDRFSGSCSSINELRCICKLLKI